MGKVAFVDGASLWHLTQDLEHDRINAFGLYNFLASIGSSHTFDAPPVVTFYKGHRGADQLAGRMKLAGFDVRRTPRGADDALILDELIATDASEIILVSQDSDFLPVVIQKVISGAQVYWVGSENAKDQTDTNFTLSKRVLDNMGENPAFVEIHSFGYQVFHEKVAKMRRIKWWWRTKRSA